MTLIAPISSLLIGGSRRFARCWRIERRDGEVLGFTDHGSKLLVGGESYSPAGTIQGSAEQHEEGTVVSNRDISGVLRSDKITEADLRAGLYRGAEVREFAIDWLYPDAGTIYSRTFHIEKTKFTGEVWKATVVSMRERLELVVGHTLQRICRWREFGGTSCGVNKAGFTVAGVFVVAELTPRRRFSCDIPTSYADDWFNDGVIEWVGGNNVGLKSEVKRWQSAIQTIELYAPTPYPMNGADGFTIVRDCDRLFATCDEVFNNALRFGGFDDLPGSDRLYEIPQPPE